MKKLAILLLFVAPVFAQTVTGSSLSFDTSTTSKCQDPVKGKAVVCGTASAVTVSFDGAPAVTLPAQGQAAIITIGSVASGAIGTAPKVTNSGTANAAVLNFTFPAPQPGANGTNGLNGKDGITGATGQQGPQGIPGPAGTATLTSADCSLVFTGQPTTEAGSVAVRITCK